LNRLFRVGVLLAVLTVPTVRADDAVSISEAKKDGGVLVHEVRSPYQAEPTQIRVLPPDKVEKGTQYPAVYVLPVEAGTENRYGDGLKEVQKLDLHNKLSAVFVAPTFSHLPWYADHPTKSEIRQESHLLKVIIPFVDKTYPVRAEADGRRLLGFSKSGWGAWSLLLRNPDVFGRAAAWDAPLMMDRPGKYGSGGVFGTPENFDGYRVSKLLEAQADKLQNGKRLVLLGYGNFRAEHEQAHALLDKLKIPHEYRDGPDRKHDWHSGWVKGAAELLLPAADWPSWRGPTRNGLSPEPSGWQKGAWVGEKPDWQVDVGDGSSSPLIVAGKLYTLGHQDDCDAVECRDTRTGKLLWRSKYTCKKYGRHHVGDEGLYAGPSSTPEFDRETKCLYTLSGDGHLNCWDTAAEGKAVWGKNLYDDFKVERRPKLTSQPQRDYGYTTSPLVYKDWLLVEVGSTKSGSLVAFDKASGKQVWASELKDEAGHCGGLALMTVDNIPCAVVLTQRNLAVIRLDAGQEGKTLGTFPWVTDFANSIASPAVQDDCVLVTAAYNQNAMVKLKVSKDGVKEVWRQKAPSKVCTPVVHRGHVYVCWQKVRCLDWETGKTVWEGGAFGDPGSCVVTADEKVIVYGLSGRLALVETAAHAGGKYVELAAREKLFRTQAWPHVALADGRVYCRDRDGHLACFSLPPK
jgi:outer membrane protein assembly factor BamB